MALVGHISGSAQSQSVIGVTGSVVFSNSVTFPSINAVGTDVVFFVSGTIGGKNVSGQKTVTVLGGDAVISGSLTVGTGSVTITSNNIQFGGPASRIELNGSDLKFFDASNPSGFTLSTLGGGGGGGGGDSYFSSLTAGEIFTTGSIVSSGSYTIKNALENAVFVASTEGHVTGTNVRLVGTEIVATNSTFNLLNTAATTTVNFAGGASTVNVGASGGTVAAPGSVTAGGGYDGTGVTLGSSGELRTKGSLQVDGSAAITGSITLPGTGQTITHTGTGNLTISSTGGNVVVEGSTFSGNDLTVPGNLTVNGSVVSIATTNLRIKDPLVLLNSGSTSSNSKSAIAFASGSSSGVNSLIFGAAGAGNVLAAAQFDVKDGTEVSAGISYSSLVPIRASKLELGALANAYVTSSNGNAIEVRGTEIVILNAGGNQFIDFDFNSVSFAELRDDTGTPRFGAVGGKDLQISGSNLILNTGLAGVDFRINNAPFAEFNTRVTNAQFGALSGKQLYLSGSRVSIDAGSDGQYWQLNSTDFARAFSGGANRFDLETQGAFSIANIVNASATTVNLGGAATTLNIGNASGVSTVRGTVTLPGSLGVQGLTSLSGSVVLGDAVGDTVTFSGRVNSSILPTDDTMYDLGSPEKRWANMYTGDLHLRNERGDWTVIEEADFLTITNNRNGKRYKFVLEEIG